MYRQSLALTFRLYPYVLLIIACELALRVFLEKTMAGNSSNSISVTVLYIILAFYAYVDILSPDTKDRKVTMRRFLGFMGRNLGLIFLIAIPAIVLTLTLYYRAGLSEQQGAQPAPETVTLIVVPSVILLSLLVLGFLGTLLPAFVVDRERGFGLAIARGKASFWYVTGRLVIGPGLLFFLSLFAFGYIPIFAGLPETWFQTDWQPNITRFVYSAVIYVLHAWAIVMTAWIFSHAFLKTEDRPAETAV